MKKKHLPLIAVMVPIGIISYIHYAFAQPGSYASNLTLANIEALLPPPDESPSVGVPCKHTANENDYCTYYVRTQDGTVIPQYEFFCINDPDYRI